MNSFNPSTVLLRTITSPIVSTVSTGRRTSICFRPGVNFSVNPKGCNILSDNAITKWVTFQVEVSISMADTEPKCLPSFEITFFEFKSFGRNPATPVDERL